MAGNLVIKAAEEQDPPRGGRLLVRPKARHSAVIEPQHGPLSPADVDLLTAPGRVAAWLQEGSA